MIVGVVWVGDPGKKRKESLSESQMKGANAAAPTGQPATMRLAGCCFNRQAGFCGWPIGREDTPFVLGPRCWDTSHLASYFRELATIVVIMMQLNEPLLRPISLPQCGVQ